MEVDSRGPRVRWRFDYKESSLEVVWGNLAESDVVAFRLEYTHAALRDLAGLPKGEAGRVVKSLENYAETGQGDIKKLRGRTEEWRLRSGNWRVIFTPDGRVLRVLRVRNRKDAY